jgi:hypothetical protein
MYTCAVEGSQVGRCVKRSVLVSANVRSTFVHRLGQVALNFSRVNTRVLLSSNSD